MMLLGYSVWFGRKGYYMGRIWYFVCGKTNCECEHNLDTAIKVSVGVFVEKLRILGLHGILKRWYDAEMRPDVKCGYVLS